MNALAMMVMSAFGECTTRDWSPIHIMGHGIANIEIGHRCGMRLPDVRAVLLGRLFLRESCRGAYSAKQPRATW